MPDICLKVNYFGQNGSLILEIILVKLRGGAAGGGRGHARAQAATSATSAWRQVAEK